MKFAYGIAALVVVAQLGLVQHGIAHETAVADPACVACSAGGSAATAATTVTTVLNAAVRHDGFAIPAARPAGHATSYRTRAPPR